MTETIQAYPLAWPAGWKRNPARSHAKFLVNKQAPSIRDGVNRVMKELAMLYVKEESVIISTNIKPTLTGGQGSNAGDPGVAVYWSRRGDARCMAVDNYWTVAGNLCAVAATLEAMRAIERHGGAAILDRAFTGFVALPSNAEAWHRVLEVLEVATVGRGRIPAQGHEGAPGPRRECLRHGETQRGARGRSRACQGGLYR